MVVIKGKEKKLDKKRTAHGMSKDVRKKLQHPQDNQPVPTVAV